MVNIAAAAVKSTAWQGSDGIITEGASPSSNNDGVGFKGKCNKPLLLDRFERKFAFSDLHPRPLRSFRSESFEYQLSDPFAQLRRCPGSRLYLLRHQSQNDSYSSITLCSTWPLTAILTRRTGMDHLKHLLLGVN